MTEYVLDGPLLFEDTVREEWMLDRETYSSTRGIFSASPEWVRENCDSELQRLANEVCFERLYPQLQDGYHLVVDSRVQMLMPGMFPSIPGWHGDATPRNHYHGQPDLDAIHPDVRHMVVTFSTEWDGVSNTRWVVEPFRVDIDYESEVKVWRQVHRQVEAEYTGDIIASPDGCFAEFGQATIHAASPAKRRGWRLFFRMGMYPRPPIGGKFRTQEQVYLLTEENGW